LSLKKIFLEHLNLFFVYTHKYKYINIPPTGKNGENIYNC